MKQNFNKLYTKDNLSRLLNYYLNYNNISINKDEFFLQLVSHHSYPSLFSITETLFFFNVDNWIFKTTSNLKTLEQLPTTFFTLINKNEFAIIERKNKLIIIKSENRKTQKTSITNFLKIWTGIVLLVDGKEKSSLKIEPNKIVLGYFIPFCTLILCSLFVAASPNNYEKLNFVLSIIGLFFSILLIKAELGYQSNTTAKFCSQNKNTDCETVLKSKSGKIFNLIKLTDLGIIYFLSTLFSKILIINTSHRSNLFEFISLTTLPMVFYSLYYQYKIIKIWCPLCLGVVLILVLQALTSILFFSNNYNFNISIIGFLLFLIISLIIITLWTFIKPLLIIKNEMSILKIETYKFKKDITIFKALLNSQDKIDIKPFYNEIILGNKNASLEILLITDPMCYYCKISHKEIEKILKEFAKKVRIILRFNTSIKNTKSKSYITCSVLLNLYNQKNSQFEKAINQIYKKDVHIDKWISNWSIDNQNNRYNDYLLQSKQWCRDNNLNFTPAIFINGKLYPKQYSIKELLFFIKNIIE